MIPIDSIEKYIKEQVKKEMKKKEQFEESKYPADKLCKSPPFVIPSFVEKNKLNGPNFCEWIQRVTLDFIELHNIY